MRAQLASRRPPDEWGLIRFTDGQLSHTISSSLGELPDVPIPPRVAGHGDAGVIGGPPIIASGTAVLFGVFEPGSGPQVIATAPEFSWELSLGIYLIVKGFKPSPILFHDCRPV